MYKLVKETKARNIIITHLNQKYYNKPIHTLLQKNNSASLKISWPQLFSLCSLVWIIATQLGLSTVSSTVCQIQ